MFICCKLFEGKRFAVLEAGYLGMLLIMTQVDPAYLMYKQPYCRHVLSGTHSLHPSNISISRKWTVTKRGARTTGKKRMKRQKSHSRNCRLSDLNRAMCCVPAAMPYTVSKKRWRREALLQCTQLGECCRRGWRSPLMKTKRLQSRWDGVDGDQTNQTVVLVVL